MISGTFEVPINNRAAWPAPEPLSFQFRSKISLTSARPWNKALYWIPKAVQASRRSHRRPALVRRQARRLSHAAHRAVCSPRILESAAHFLINSAFAGNQQAGPDGGESGGGGGAAVFEATVKRAVKCSPPPAPEGVWIRPTRAGSSHMSRRFHLAEGELLWRGARRRSKGQRGLLGLPLVWPRWACPLGTAVGRPDGDDG